MKSECECGSMNPGRHDPSAGVDRPRRRARHASPTPAMRPSRTATDPVTDGAPVPSMMRALVMRRSKGRAWRLRRDRRGQRRGRRLQRDGSVSRADYMPASNRPGWRSSHGMIRAPRAVSHAHASSATAAARDGPGVVSGARSCTPPTTSCCRASASISTRLRVQARHSRAGGGDRRPDERELWRGAFGQQDVERNIVDPARHALPARRHDAGDRRVAGGQVRVGRLAVARRSRSASSRRRVPTRARPSGSC